MIGHRFVLAWIFFIGGLVIVNTQPLTAIGNQMGPGWSDVLNGGLGLLCLILGGVLAFLSRKRG